MHATPFVCQDKHGQDRYGGLDYVSPNTPFRIGSNGKAITAALVRDGLPGTISTVAQFVGDDIGYTVVPRKGGELDLSNLGEATPTASYELVSRLLGRGGESPPNAAPTFDLCGSRWALQPRSCIYELMLRRNVIVWGIAGMMAIAGAAAGCDDASEGSNDLDAAAQDDAGGDAGVLEDASPTADADAGSVDGDAAGNADAGAKWETLISSPFTVLPTREAFECMVIPVPKDIYITGFRRVVSNTDVWMQTLTVEDSASETGAFGCPSSSRPQQGLLYASSINTGDLVFPPGVAMHVPAGKFLMLRTHVVNRSAATLMGSTGVAVLTTDASQVVHEADMVFGGAEGGQPIPNSGAPHDVVGGCILPVEWNVFAVWPHMQTLGTHMAVVRKTGSTTVGTLHDGAFSHTSQAVYSTSEHFAINDGLLVTCTYVNGSDHAVDFGDNLLNEACLAGIYKYPTGGQTYGLCVTPRE